MGGAHDKESDGRGVSPTVERMAAIDNNVDDSSFLTQVSRESLSIFHNVRRRGFFDSARMIH
ncbi:hypothetical protein CH302_26095 [Rhodococcus sp. 15-2388-1-1a]|nr:hypothetical protein CH302_26095 [Rhodococcus sp. 15-2388-1-1a]